MKSILKTIVIIKYSTNPEGLTYESLKNYLAENKMLPASEFDYIAENLERVVHKIIEENIQEPSKVEAAFGSIVIYVDKPN
jgi:hypothetical protein